MPLLDITGSWKCTPLFLDNATDKPLWVISNPYGLGQVDIKDDTPVCLIIDRNSSMFPCVTVYTGQRSLERRRTR